MRCARLRCPAGRALVDAELVELKIDTSAIAAALRCGDAASDRDARGGVVHLSCAPLERAASTAAPARRLHADRLACDTLLLLTARSGARVLAHLSARDDLVSTSTVAPPRGGCATLVCSGDDRFVAAMPAPGELVLHSIALGEDDGSVALALAPRRAPPCDGGAPQDSTVVCALASGGARGGTLVAALSDGCAVVWRRTARFGWEDSAGVDADAARGGGGVADEGVVAAEAEERSALGTPRELVARAVEAFNAGAIEPRGVLCTAAALGAFILSARYCGVDRAAVAAQCNARPELCAAIADALPLSGVALPLALDHLATVVDLDVVLSETALDSLLSRFVEAYFEKNGAGEEGGGVSVDVARALCAQRIAQQRCAAAARPGAAPPATSLSGLPPHLVALFDESRRVY